MTVQPNEQAALQSLISDGSTLNVADTSHSESYGKVIGLAKYLQMGLILACVIIGSIAAPIAFRTDNDQQLNIFWLLIVLLGTHFLSLLLWLLSQLRQPSQSSHSSAWFTVILKKAGRLLGLPEQTLTHFMRLRFSGATGTWHLSRIVHSAWAAYLVGGLVSALLFLMTHQVQFVWETTLLTQADFRSLTQTISLVPAWLGIAVPSVDDIALSQIGQLAQPDETRKTWAIWILSCVLIYGVAVRLLLTALCHGFYCQQRQALWRSLLPVARSSTKTQREILDADSAPQSKTSAKPISPAVVAVTPNQAQTLQYFLFEWSRTVPSSLGQEATISTINDSQAQRNYLEDNQAGRIIIIDTEVSPDRGSLRFMGRAQACTQAFYLSGESFVEAWSQALLEQGIQPEQIARLSDYEG